MNYIVIELQTTNGSTANIVTSHATRESAEAKFHQILASAATSSVETHAAVLLAEDGRSVRAEHYIHNTEDGGEN